MYTALILAIVLTATTLYLIRSVSGILELIMMLILGFIVYFVISALLLLFISNFIPNSTTNVIENHENWIYSIKSDNSVNGSFVLGCGTIKDEQVYEYYIKTNYGYELKSISADNSAIKEIKSKHPEIVKRTSEFKNKKLNDWFIPPSPNGPEYFIYVPMNTVKQNFSL